MHLLVKPLIQSCTTWNLTVAQPSNICWHSPLRRKASKHLQVGCTCIRPVLQFTQVYYSTLLAAAFASSSTTFVFTMIWIHLVCSVIVISGRSGRLAGPRAAISVIVWVDLVAAVICAGFILRQHIALSRRHRFRCWLRAYRADNCVEEAEHGWRTYAFLCVHMLTYIRRVT